MDIDIETLIETNKRLNRRCQRLESLVVKYRRRYVAVQHPLADAQQRCADLAKMLKSLWSEMYYNSWKRRCVWCKFRRMGL